MKFATVSACLSLIPASFAANSVFIGNDEYINYGLSGYGFVPGDAIDKYKDTISFGSSISLHKPSLSVSNGVYTFVTYNLPDRGWNTNGTLNYAPRIHKYGVTFTPKNSSSSANLVWNYQDTILLKDFNGQLMTGLDCNTTVYQNGHMLPATQFVGDGFGGGLNTNSTTTRVCLDPEALRIVKNDISNGFWITDEYGPGIFRFDSNGNLIDYTLPPDAIVPFRNGTMSFSANSPPLYEDYDTGDPDSGRANNQGFEGATLSPDGKHLYALLQSAAMQEGGSHKYTNEYVRMVKYDVSGSSPVLEAEYVLRLPTYEDPEKDAAKNPRVAAQSELVYVSDEIFMVLARDSGRGRAQDNTTSLYRHADLYSIANATNIAGKYDKKGDKIASNKGKLEDGITTATYYSFLDYNNQTELSKFGLHNGGKDDSMLLNEKWEGITLIPVECTTDEYFLLTVSDDDFITQNGFMNFGKFLYSDASGANLDNQALMFHVKLPALTHENTCTSLSSLNSTDAATSCTPQSLFQTRTTTAYRSTSVAVSVASDEGSGLRTSVFGLLPLVLALL
ncbi:hypothetical protein KL930_002108 [Ogataea haglerorum]|nr:hypothetical protein KL914_001057 [Ogataea haglerorum]KAG7711072.1 hypothetical protein KL950_001038 [Ogataea haglerorum]KAG7740976.1 hypothetical protein KL923_001617 [Ogataea haglerorum]KAG7744118.1 hypothetical protein KL932_001441 [Ogataea haglerorum]KAG7770794.1 hypothetical protein KL931_001616 [Ogataea haglerorum]